MTAGAVWLAGWIALPVLGAPLLSHPIYRSFSRPTRAVLAGAVGAVVLSFCMTIVALAGLPWAPLPLAVVSTAITWGLRLTVGGAATRVPLAEPEIVAARLLSGAAVGTALLATLGGAAGSSDLLLFWGPKAQAFAAARTIDAGFLASAAASHMHPYYPPLVSNVDALATMLAGRFPWSAATLTFPLLLAALAIALPSLLRRGGPSLGAGAIAALIVSTLALLGAEADVAGNADPVLWLFEILGLALLLSPPPIEAPRLLLAGILLAGAAAAKVEGLPFAAAAGVFFLLGAPRGSRRARDAALVLGPTALTLSAWFLFGLSRNAFATYGEYGSLFGLRFDRLGMVLREIERSFGDTGFALPYLVPLAVWLLCGMRGVRRLPLAVAAALAAFLLATYLLPVPDPSRWIAWSAGRTFAPIPVLLALSLSGSERGVEPGQTSRASVSRSVAPEIQRPATNELGQ